MNTSHLISYKHLTNRNKTVSFGTLRLHVHHKLHVLNLAKRLEDATQHVLGNVEVERADVEAHRTVGSFVEGAHGGHVTAGQSVLLGLSWLDNDGNPKQFLAG